jgi:hypothetical protein
MAPLTPFVIKSSTSDSWFIQVLVSNGQLQTDTVYLHLFLHRVGQQHVKEMLLGEERCADDDLFCLACWPTPTIRNPQAATGGKQSMYFLIVRGARLIAYFLIGRVNVDHSNAGASKVKAVSP